MFMKMIFLSVLLLIASFSYAQIRLGFKAGLNVATIKDEGLNSKARVGLNAGGIVQIKLPGKFLLRPELLYSLKGNSIPAGQYHSKVIRSFHYIAIPVLIGFRPTENFALLAGPEFGFLAKATSRYDGSNNDISKFYNDFDMGVDLGLAYNITKNIGIDLRYNYGFKVLVDGVFTDQNGNVIAQRKTGANRIFQVGVYYFISK